MHIQTIGSAQFEYNVGRRTEKEKWTLLIQSAHMIQAPILILGVVVVFHALLYCFRPYIFRHAHQIRVTLIFKKVAFLKLITRIKSFRKKPISDVPKMEKHENLLMIKVNHIFCTTLIWTTSPNKVPTNLFNLLSSSFVHVCMLACQDTLL